MRGPRSGRAPAPACIALALLVPLAAIAGVASAALQVAGAAAAQSPVAGTAVPPIAGPAATQSPVAGAAATGSPVAGAAVTQSPVAGTPESRSALLERAREARVLEEVGSYAGAAEVLRRVRREVPRDADLDLELALDEARGGRPDSAAALLWEPLVAAALRDSLPEARRRFFTFAREGLWVNGQYDGWRWYIARARAEVALALGRWREARDAARVAVDERPLAGKEWLLLAVSAGRAGELAEARAAAVRAAALDPSLPEAHYFSGLWAWRDGRRAEADDSFRRAAELDSLYRDPALARVRLMLPGSRPDSLPGYFLTGPRGVGMITSPMRPKLEEFVQMDLTPRVARIGQIPVPDSVEIRLRPEQRALPVLVDQQGRVVLHELLPFPPDLMPASAVASLVGSLPEWRFQPAMKGGEPRIAWATVSFRLDSP
ncbi:MAG: hypothetical protein A2W00_03870 [Candidatus Eisenbacteria bacterium RBG_16_71_46]|nr:MAG: hypothetical protein A2W00_03870 [Candidatus Eisenbacteria bacterium RBG_16_71_46]